MWVRWPSSVISPYRVVLKNHSAAVAPGPSQASEGGVAVEPRPHLAFLGLVAEAVHGGDRRAESLDEFGGRLSCGSHLVPSLPGF